MAVSRIKTIIKLHFGDLLFSNLQGDFLERPYLKKSTFQHSLFHAVINDPDDKLRPRVEQSSDAIVEIGFAKTEDTPEDIRSVYTGKLYSVGRKSPDGCEIYLTDIAYLMQNKVGASIEYRAESPLTAEIYTEQIPSPFVRKTPTETQHYGRLRMQQSKMSKGVGDALLYGDTVVTYDNTIYQIAAQEGDMTDLVLDYLNGRESFITAKVTRKAGISLQSGYGTLTVTGWSVNDKKVVGATLVTPLDPPPATIQSVQVLDYGELYLDDPVVNGGIYTWNDVTRNGTRVPTKEVMNNATQVAAVLEDQTEKVDQGKWKINSWYKPKDPNFPGTSDSRHFYGDAVDVSFPSMDNWYQSQVDYWQGGLAINQGAFVHVDTYPVPRRWRY